MAWGRKQANTPSARDSQVAKIKTARAANEAAQRNGHDGAEIRKTAAIYQRVVDNSSDSELVASGSD